MALDFPIPTAVGETFTDATTGNLYVCLTVGPPAVWTTGPGVDPDAGTFVTTSTDQTITGNKFFEPGLEIGGTVGSPNATLAADGSATFAGSASFGNGNFDLASYGALSIKRTDGNNLPLFRWGTDNSYTGGSISPDGSASFSGAVLVGGALRTTGDYTGTDNGGIHLSYDNSNKRSMITVGSSDANPGALYFAFALGGADPKSNTPIQFNYDGSATFAGNATLAGGITTADNIAVSRTLSTSACYVGQLNGSDTSSILADGSATFAGTVTASNITAFKLSMASAVASATDLAALKQAIINAVGDL